MRSKWKLIACLITLPLPWLLRRVLLQLCCGYCLHPTSRIGLALVYVDELVMGEHTSIGHLTVCKGLRKLHMGAHSSIGRGNWITGFPAENKTFFAHQTDRVPELIIGAQSAITHRHIIDCTNAVHIGEFTTVAGYRSQILTHSIDLMDCRQSSAPVTIGDYCFVGTDCVLLGGSALPSYSALGAKSLLNKAYTETHSLYAGVPAKPLKSLEPEMKYFQRDVGFVQ
jgi:acetyltransferase-like isoleucine patch superfamily enzyme